MVIEGAKEVKTTEEECFWADLSVKEHVEKYISEGISQKEAVKMAATDRGVPKRDVYNEYHKD